MQLRRIFLFVLGALSATAAGLAQADDAKPAPPADVTITVIPAGQDVTKTVVQTITVPPAANHKSAKGATASQFGQQTAAAGRQNGENHEATQAEESAEQAQQQAEEAAERQAAQAQQQAQQQALQAQQQAQEQRQKHQPPPHPPLS